MRRDVRIFVGLWVISDWPDKDTDPYPFTSLTRRGPLNTALVNTNGPVGTWFRSHMSPLLRFLWWLSSLGDIQWNPVSA